MKLSDWACKEGITYQTAWNRFKVGKLPVITQQTAAGAILVGDSTNDTATIAIYARAASLYQGSDLDRQVARLSDFAARQGWRWLK